MEDKYQESFEKNIGKVLSPSDKAWKNVMGYWGAFIKEQSKKGLVPLFITGSGTSIDANVPSLWGIINYLLKTYEKKRKANEFQYPDKIRDVGSLIEKYQTTHTKNKTDKTIVASLLSAFQEDDQLKDKVWNDLNIWLLGEILKAKPSPFHENLAKLYRDVEVNAICLTLNFDGLLIRHFAMEKERAFSLPNKKECENFFLRTGNRHPTNQSKKDQQDKEYIEVQIRGDILYVKCSSKQFCPNKSDDAKHSLWANIASIFDNKQKDLENIHEELLKCPYCGEIGSSYLSFPGSYEKEKDMRQLLEVLWRYLAFRISCVTIVGLSGEWDPLIVAFLGDLLSEREIPLMVVDKNAKKVDESNTNDKKVDESKNSYIIKELVMPGLHAGIAIRDDADHFSEELVKNIDNYKLPKIDHPDQEIIYNQGESVDKFWYQMIDEADNSGISLASINRKFSKFELDLKIAIEDDIKLDNFA